MMKNTRATQADASPDPTVLLLQDLAVLTDGPSIDLHFAFDGGVIVMRSNDSIVFHENADFGAQIQTMRLVSELASHDVSGDDRVDFRARDVLTSGSQGPKDIHSAAGTDDQSLGAGT